MNLYFAARYGRRDELAHYRAQAEASGHVVTSRWLDGHNWGVADCRDRDFELRGDMPPEAAPFAMEDCEDIAQSDCIVSFTEAPETEKGVARGGRHVEFGLGLAWGKRMIVVGHRENVFHWLPSVEFAPTWGDALRIIGESRDFEGVAI